jgi:SAM-dependent methyltransferase
MKRERGLTEAQLCQKILEIPPKKSPKLFGLTRQTDDQIERPIGNPSKVLSKENCKQVLDFFNKLVIPFAVLLNRDSEQITNTLDFDVHRIFTQVYEKSEKIVRSGDHLVKRLPKSTGIMAKKAFRSIVWPWIRDSYFVSRGLLKPYGYPGDYVIVEAMYDGNPRSMGMGYIYDSIFLKTQLCQGLRNRKDQMKQVLNNYFTLNKKDEVKILNVGCGGSRELREIILPNDGAGVELSLIDFDKRALDFSMKELEPKVPKANIIPLNTDVRQLINKKGLKDGETGKYDLIYSIGLFDYLPDNILTRLIENMVALLEDGGLFIFAHKDCSVYDPRISDWFCDWNYYCRTQKAFEQIMKKLGISRQNVNFSREKDGYIFFAKISKTSAKNKP